MDELTIGRLAIWLDQHAVELEVHVVPSGFAVTLTSSGVFFPGGGREPRGAARHQVRATNSALEDALLAVMCAFEAARSS